MDPSVHTPEAVFEYCCTAPSVELVSSIQDHGAQTLFFTTPVTEDTEEIFPKLLTPLLEAGFPEELTDRFLFASEAVHNALRYAHRGTSVEFVLILLGHGMHRSCVLMVENELDPRMELRVPRSEEPVEFDEHSIVDTHGRGFKLLRLHADTVSVRLYPALFRLRTIACFDTRPEPGALA